MTERDVVCFFHLPKEKKLWKTTTIPRSKDHNTDGSLASILWVNVCFKFSASIREASLLPLLISACSVRERIHFMFVSHQNTCWHHVRLSMSTLHIVLNLRCSISSYFISTEQPWITSKDFLFASLSAGSMCPSSQVAAVLYLASQEPTGLANQNSFASLTSSAQICPVSK